MGTPSLGPYRPWPRGCRRGGISTGAPLTMNVVLGVDVGGTTIAAGVVTETGQVLAEARLPTHHAGRGTAVSTILALTASMHTAAAERGLRAAGIGVGVPALVDVSTGRIGEEALNVPELGGVTLATSL